MSTNASTDLNLQMILEKAVRLLCTKDPQRLGYWLMLHLCNEHLTEGQLLEQLGVTPASLTLLMLCQTPRQELFQEDLAKIVEVTQVSPIALAGLLRQEQNLHLFRRGMGTSTPATSWLLAAHTENQPAFEGEDDPRSS